MAIEQIWTMKSTDILFTGQKLGYDWNFLCREVSREGLHGQDGSGYTTMAREEIEDLASEALKAIFCHIFAEHPSMDEVTIIDNK